MKEHAFRMSLALLLFVCMGVAACQQHDPDKEGVGVLVTGVDYLPDHLSVQRFSVNGQDMGRAGGGGGGVCCAMLPVKWQPGMTVKITWNVTNWRDCTGKNYEAVVPVEKYDKVGNLFVSFFPNQKVRVVSSNYGVAGARMTGSKYPIKAVIPDKHPWDKWPPDSHCPQLYK